MKKQSNDIWLTIYTVTAQVAIAAVWLGALAIVGVIGAALTIGKYGAGAALILKVLN